jgi:hypothetical protein
MPNPNSTKGESPPYLITEPLTSVQSFTPIELANGDLRMAIAIKDQKAYSVWGDEFTLSEEFLKKDFKTWEGGLISTNHENTNDLLGGAYLYDIEYDSEKGLVIASFGGMPDKAKAFIKSEFYTGISQESIAISFKKNSNIIIKGYGVGATLVMWPHQPAATQEQVVGVPPALASILSFKYPQTEDTMPTDKQGGGTPAISTEAYEIIVSEKVQLNSRITALESENKKLKDDYASIQSEFEKYKSGEDTRIKTAVESALESFKADIKAAGERETAVSELKSVMTEDAAKNYLETNPTIDQIKSITKILKANFSKGVGSPQGDNPDPEKSYEQLDSEWKARLGRS